eukprot:490183-Rhodomonas_salina.1
MDQFALSHINSQPSQEFQLEILEGINGFAHHESVTDVCADDETVRVLATSFSHPDGVLKPGSAEALLLEPLAQREVERPCRAGDAIEWTQYLVHNAIVISCPLLWLDEHPTVDPFIQLAET